MITQIEFSIPPYNRGFHLITSIIEKKLNNLPPIGFVHLLLKHTSAAITLNENADATVRFDFHAFMNQLIPDGISYFKHTLEGNDDMSAHIKSSIIGQQLTIPITGHRFNLGLWQGIYLCEFRDNAKARTIIATIYS